MDTVTITILVAIVGCLVGVANWVRNTRGDTDQLVAYVTKLETQITHLEEQISDLKSEIKVTQTQIQKAIEDSITAKNTAMALHTRLDSDGIQSSGRFKK